MALEIRTSSHAGRDEPPRLEADKGFRESVGFTFRLDLLHS